MNWPFRAAVAAIFVLPAAAVAEPLLSFGPDIPLFLTASVSVRYDDNVLLSPTDKVSDTIYLFTPGVDLHFSGGSANAGITFSEQFSKYEKDHGLDDQLANLAANIGYHGSESNFGLTGSYQQIDQTTTTATSLDETVKHTIEAVAANAEVAITAKTRVGVTPSFTRVEFPQVGYTDSDVFTLPVDIYFGITAKTDLSVGYAYSDTTTADGSGDAKGNFFNVGARGQFTEKLSGQVRVGVTENKPKVGESTSQIGVQSNLNYAYSPKTTFSLYVNNGFAPSAAGNQTEVLSTGLSGNFALSNAWSASVAAGESSTKYLIVPSRTDHFWNLDFSVTYIITQNLNLQASYLYRKNVSTIEAVTFDDNLATLTAACRF
jgi:polysaccharide biosynthesis protein VpsM